MPISLGTRFGSYEITGALGSGGMGEVYRARDSNLKRDVAIKVLPTAFAADAERLARFRREAEVLASLSHPNINAVYDLQSAGETQFLVLELVEGETLADRLRRGSLPLTEALDVAKQIASALEAAHRKGVLHRDLKPSNVQLTREGLVKVLDFGLAKVIAPVTTEPSESATVVRAIQTQAGVILGTPAYMSPEQARGQPLDQRTDLWSLGCVLYECLTGKLAFDGGDYTETLASLLRSEPDWHSLPTSTPPIIRSLLRQCLRKQPGERGGAARALRLLIEDGLATPTDATSPAAVDSLAVLPFEASAATVDTEYLSEGLTEALINTLAELPTVRVTARSTAFRYKDRDPLEAGRELGVRAVLAGRVSQYGETLVVGADFVEVATGSQLWGQQYRRRFADIFDIQEEIAHEISAKLLTKITTEQRQQLGRRNTNDPDAYRAYLRGRYHWNQRTLADMRRAVDFFNAAIGFDPTYGVAYAGLGDALAMLGIYQGLRPHQAFPRAKAAARRALEIAPDSAEALAALGFSTLYFDWDFARAERSLVKAIDIKPQYASAHQWYGMCLGLLGRTDEAIERFNVAREIDPLSASINYTAAWPLYWARRTEEAIDRLEEAVDLHPTFWGAHYYLGLANAARGDMDAALTSLMQAQKLADNAWLWEGMGYCYALAGRTADAEAVLEKLDRMAVDTYVAPYSYAVIYSGLGEIERGIESLVDAARDRSWRMAWLDVDPALDRLRAHPRFPSLRGASLAS